MLSCFGLLSIRFSIFATQILCRFDQFCCDLWSVQTNKIVAEMNGTNCQENIEDIDDIMAEMEAKTPKPGDSKSFEIIFELQTTNISLQVPEVSLERPKSYDTIFAKKPAEEIAVAKVPDAVDAKGYWSKIFTKEPNKPGKTYPSMPTNERYYDFTHDRVGAALIFNQVKISGETERTGSLKDAKDLEVVLADIGFDVKVCNDFSIAEIKAELVGCNSLFMTQIKHFLI